jgi:hypothetical protein
MNDHQLDLLLLESKREFTLEAGFQRKVWSRIEAEAVPPAVFHGLLDWLLRPLGIAAGVAAMVALGLFLGAASVPGKADQGLSYIESISPFVGAKGR